jgi:hypothetical protein
VTVCGAGRADASAGCARAWAAIALLGTACSRTSAPLSVEASTVAAPVPSAMEGPGATSQDSAGVPPSVTSDASPTTEGAPIAREPPHEPVDLAPAGQATRTTLAALDRAPLLRPQLAKLRAHFGSNVRGPFTMQRVALAAGRVGVLVSRADESDPIVLELDRDQLVFAKERPTAGIAPPVVHATIAPAPERGIAVFAYVESMHIVAARMWADDSNPYADIDVYHPPACDALTVGYEPHLGWIVACASKTGTLAQRLEDDLTAAWGQEGLPVGTTGPVGPAQIGFDGPSDGAAAGAWTLGQRAKAVGGDRTLTFRYGAEGEAR